MRGLTHSNFNHFFSLYLILDANYIQNTLKKTFSQSICSRLNFLQLLCCEQVHSVDFIPLPNAWICPRKKNLARVSIWLILLASKIRIQINGCLCPHNFLGQVLLAQQVWYRLYPFMSIIFCVPSMFETDLDFDSRCRFNLDLSQNVFLDVISVYTIFLWKKKKVLWCPHPSLWQK